MGMYTHICPWLPLVTKKEVNDRVSMKNTQYRKSTLLCFLKVCLYSCYNNPPFCRISLFHQLNIDSHKISENHFLRIALNLYLKFIKVDMNFKNSFQIFFEEKCF